MPEEQIVQDFGYALFIQFLGHVATCCSKVAYREIKIILKMMIQACQSGSCCQGHKKENSLQPI